MPVVRVEILEGRAQSEKQALLDAVHAGVVEGLRVPDSDRTQRLTEHPRGAFETSPHRSEKFTLVEITMFPGRSLEAKRRLYQALVRNLGALGTPASDVFVILHEPPMENWSVWEGVPASEMDLGFEVRV
jgi:phenylpyruvate tautomerase PptA (4-oxalocrotonate tautomerase family)